MTLRLNDDDTVTVTIGDESVTMTVAAWSYLISHPVRAIGTFRPVV